MDLQLWLRYPGLSHPYLPFACLLLFRLRVVGQSEAGRLRPREGNLGLVWRAPILQEETVPIVIESIADVDGPILQCAYDENRASRPDG